MKLPVKLAYAYSAASIIIGPAILIYGENLYPHKLACFDAEQNIHPLFENTIHQYRVTQLYETIPSLALIVVGAALLILLVYSSRKKPAKETYTLAIAGLIIMIIGYSLIIGFSALMTACIS
jgi:hypothetical protein